MKITFNKLFTCFYAIAPFLAAARSCVGLFACLVTLTAQVSAGSDVELHQRTSKLEAAMTQAEMNNASGKLAEFWEQKLKAIEQKIEAKLNKKERKQFAKSRQRWRSYRTGEVAFRARFFEGGSIQPLIANTAYYEITEHRVSDLESLFVVAFQGGPN